MRILSVSRTIFCLSKDVLVLHYFQLQANSPLCFKRPRTVVGVVMCCYCFNLKTARMGRAVISANRPSVSYKEVLAIRGNRDLLVKALLIK